MPHLYVCTQLDPLLRTIEQVWVVRRGLAVQLPDVEQVIELAVHIATHGEVGASGHINIYQRSLRFEQRLGLWCG